ncbi:hypothetical protein [Ancylobacter moscoviensis]
MTELPQWWVLTGLVATVAGSVMTVWGAIATHRARRSEARWKGPEITLSPSRQDEEGWVQMLVLVRNRLDVEMRLESIEILRPRRAVVLDQMDWQRKGETDVVASSRARIGHPVSAGPSDKHWSAKVPVFIKADGWDPYAEPVQARVVLRETSMQRRDMRIKVVSMDMKRPPPEVKEPPVMPRSRDPWLANDRRERFWDRY